MSPRFSCSAPLSPHVWHFEGKGMIILLGKAACEPQGASSGVTEPAYVVAIVRAADVRTAEKTVVDALRDDGFSNFTVEESEKISTWLALLPTSRGREIRRALRYGCSNTVFVPDDLPARTQAEE